MGGQESDQSILPLPMLDLWSGPKLRRRDLPEPPPPRPRSPWFREVLGGPSVVVVNGMRPGYLSIK